MSRLLEATHIHHGTFQDLKTFLDKEGNEYELQKSVFSSKPNQQQQQDQSQNNKPPQPKFVTPDKGQVFKDVNTGKTYTWDGKKFVIQR